MSYLPVIIGLFVTILLGLAVGPLVGAVKKSMDVPPPNDALKEKWETLTQEPKCNKSGAYLGHLERLVFFVGIWWEASEILAAWLAFKVAAKWEVWNNIVAVPKSLEHVDELDYLISRRRWGSQRLMTFLIGSLANVVAGFFGVAAGRYGYDTLMAMICGK